MKTPKKPAHTCVAGAFTCPACMPAEQPPEVPCEKHGVYANVETGEILPCAVCKAEVPAPDEVWCTVHNGSVDDVANTEENAEFLRKEFGADHVVRYVRAKEGGR